MTAKTSDGTKRTNYQNKQGCQRGCAAMSLAAGGRMLHRSPGMPGEATRRFVFSSNIETQLCTMDCGGPALGWK
jgi:hypothetical protein